MPEHTALLGRGIMAQTNILLESGTNELEIVEFYIDEADGYRAHYGVNVSKVLEILRDQQITAMPEMRHPSVVGAFKHRDDTIVPLIDLAIYLGRNRAETKETKVIVTEFNEVTSAFQVSGVNRIHRMSWESVEAPGEFLQAVSQSAITGVVRLEERVVFLIDLETIVGDLDSNLAIKMTGTLAGIEAKKQYTVVHCDDSSSVRGLVRGLLEEGGHFNVVQFTNGRDGWDYLKQKLQEAQAQETEILDMVQGVISDIEMPQMDGHNLCRRIKDTPGMKELPVALFSSLITERLEHKGTSVGADAQFAKPDLQKLGEYMLNLLQSRGL